MTARFDGFCVVCRGPLHAGVDSIVRSGRGWAHANAATCAATPKPVLPTAEANAKPIADFLLAAVARGKKFPKVRFLAPAGGTLLLSVAGPTSTAPGSIQVKLDGTWIGRIEPDGRVVGPRLATRTDLLTALDSIAADPVTAAKSYAQLTSSCSLCGLRLANDGSIEVGYGKRCAEKHGLPWHGAKPRVLGTAPGFDQNVGSVLPPA